MWKVFIIFFWFIIISKIDMATATISTLLVPVFGLLLSSILLDEKLTPNILIGSALIVVGIFIATKRKKAAKIQTKKNTRSKSSNL